jgi:hypothetical protein
MAKHYGMKARGAHVGDMSMKRTLFDTLRKAWDYSVSHVKALFGVRWR